MAFLGTAIVLLPLLVVIWISFLEGLPGQGEYTLQNYAGIGTDAFVNRVLVNTLIFATGSTFLALSIGAPLAWAVARTDLPFKHGVAFVMGIVLVIPGFVQGIGWASILAPRVGFANQAVADIFQVADGPFDIYTLPGMIFVQGLTLAPQAFYIVLPVLLAMDASFEEASFMSGVTKRRTFVRINLPLALPALAAAAIYLFVLSASLFDVPAVLGIPQNEFVFSTMIFLMVTAPAALPAYGAAAAYGMIIVVVGLLILFPYIRILQRGRHYATIGGKGRRTTIQPLGRWRAAAVALTSLYLILAIVLPSLALVYNSLLPFSQILSWEALQSLTLEHYTALVDLVGLGPFLNTTILIVVVPLVVIVLGLPISWVVVRSRLPGRFLMDAISFIPLAVPRVVIGLAVLYLALVTRAWVPIYGTIVLIAFAHVILFLGFVTKSLNAALVQIHPELEEAGMLSGASRSAVLLSITAPLLKPALFFAWFWVLLLTYREITVAIMLASPKSVVLPTLIWNRWSTGQVQEAAAAGVIMVGMSFVLVMVLRRQFRNALLAGAPQ